jgi:hypothetical protein
VKAISGAANMVHEVGFAWAQLPSPWSSVRMRTMYKGMRRVSKSLGVRSTHGYVLTEREYRDMIIHLYKKAKEVLETHTNKAYKYMAAAEYASACCFRRARLLRFPSRFHETSFTRNNFLPIQSCATTSPPAR